MVNCCRTKRAEQTITFDNMFKIFTYTIPGNISHTFVDNKYNDSRKQRRWQANKD